jgi:hypothetical protein
MPTNDPRTRGPKACPLDGPTPPGVTNGAAGAPQGPRSGRSARPAARAHRATGNCQRPPETAMGHHPRTGARNGGDRSMAPPTPAAPRPCARSTTAAPP